MKALLTRPEQDAAPLARELAARGIEPIVAPMLAIAPVANAAHRIANALAGAQALLFTSANGARVFATAVARRELPVFAVGDASAAAARLAGFRTVASAGGDVGDLAALVAARLNPQHGPVVHIGGSSVAGDLAGSLGARGFTVRRAAIYDAIAADRLPEDAATALRRGEVSFALFFSPRTAAVFVRLAAAAGLRQPCCGVVAFALSAAVATALADFDWRAVRVAAAPSQRDLLTALDAWLAERAGAA